MLRDDLWNALTHTACPVGVNNIMLQRSKIAIAETYEMLLTELNTIGLEVGTTRLSIQFNGNTRQISNRVMMVYHYSNVKLVRSLDDVQQLDPLIIKEVLRALL